MNLTEEEIKGSWSDKNEKPLVSIRCSTYNHAQTIGKTLDGILMQKTSFPFEIIIHDDSSTDGAEQIIRKYEKKYPGIIVAMYEEENQYSAGNLRVFREGMDEKMRGKYVAWCEGDDLWTDRSKLQRQVDYLEKHPDYSLCYHPVLYQDVNGNSKGNDRRFSSDTDVPEERIIAGGGLFCASCSLVYRKSDYVEWPRFREMSDVWDYPLQIHLALKGKVRYINRVMGIYHTSVSGSWSEMVNKDRKRMCEHYKCEQKWLKELDSYTNGKYRESIKCHLVDYMSETLVPCGICTRKKAWKMWKKLKMGKEKMRLAIRLSTASVRGVIKKRIPVVVDIYKKVRFGVSRG